MNTPAPISSTPTPALPIRNAEYLAKVYVIYNGDNRRRAGPGIGVGVVAFDRDEICRVGILGTVFLENISRDVGLPRGTSDEKRCMTKGKGQEWIQSKVQNATVESNR